MSLLKFHYLLTIILTTAVFSASTAHELSKTYVHPSPIPHNIAGGIIVMDDVILAITVNNPSDIIADITIMLPDQTIVFQSEGCNSNNCTFDLSELDRGVYSVVVHTQEGESFSGQIER